MYASAGGLCRLARRAADSPGGTHALRTLVAQSAGFNAMDIAALAEQGDAAAKQAFGTFGEYLGLGIANLISTLDLPMVVVGGGVASSWPLFAPSMFQALEKHSVVYRLMQPSQHDTMEPGHTLIVPASLGPSAGLLGASLLPHLIAGEQNRNAKLYAEVQR